MALLSVNRPFKTWFNNLRADLISLTGVVSNIVGDGVTDDTAAFQSAINAIVTAGKGTIYITGTTKITSDLTVAAPVASLRILGADPTTSIISASGVDRPINFVGTTGAVATLASSVLAGAISVSLVAGGGANFAADDLARVDDGTKQELWEIRSVSGDILTLKTPSRFAYSSGGATKSVTKINGIKNLTIQGIGFQSGTAAINVQDAANVKIKNCKVISYSNIPAFLLTLCNRIRITDNDITGGGEVGIQLTKCGHIRIEGNTVHDTDYPGIALFDYCSAFRIGDNDIYKAKTYGVLVNNYVESGVVADNTIDGIIRIPGGSLDSNAYGIVLQTNIESVSVTGNTIRGGNTGIYLSQGANHCTVDGNTIKSGRKGARGSHGITASKSGITVTKTVGRDFTLGDVGMTIVWDAPASTTDTIIAFISATAVMVSASATIASQTATLGFGDSNIVVAGIYLDTNCLYNTIETNTINDQDQAGIVASTGCNFNKIGGNIIDGWNYDSDGAMGDGINVGDSSGCIVEGNILDQQDATALTNGVVFGNSPKGVIALNKIRNAAVPIRLSGTTDATTMFGNEIEDNASAEPVTVGTVFRGFNYPSSENLSPSSDISVTGGYRQTIDGWYYNNPTAPLVAVAMARLGSDSVPTAWIAPRAGSITGLAVFSNDARTAGTCTITIYKNGSEISGPTAILNAGATTFKANTYTKDTYTFAAGDRLELYIAADASWAPTTADIRGVLEVET